MSGEQGMTPPPKDSILDFWNDKTSDLHESGLRREPPSMPATLPEPFQVVNSPSKPHEALMYLIGQICKTKDKALIIRCMASATAIIFKDSGNMTGAAKNPDELSGLEPLVASPLDENAPLVTNLENAEPLVCREVKTLLDADTDELAAYIGVLFLAGVKRLTPQNGAAFNENRVRNVQSVCTSDLKLFVSGSPFLSDAVLNRVYASFTSMTTARAFLVKRTSEKMGRIHMGMPVAFSAMFQLLVDNGLGSLRIIKEAVKKYEWIRTDFPELQAELNAANAAQQRLKTVAAAERPFIKTIYGATFVPVAQSQISNLLGVCKYTLMQTIPTYRRFNGGVITADQEEKCRQHLQLSSYYTPQTASSD